MSVSDEPADESQRVTITEVVHLLDETGTPYMLTGSVASSLHGEPRATLDIDIVVDPTESSIARLVTQLETRDYYVDLTAARSLGRARPVQCDSSAFRLEGRLHRAKASAVCRQ